MREQNTHEVMGEKTLPDKITALKNLAKSFDMKMNGYKSNSSNDSWVICGKALATSNLINQATGILSSFAENANLITTKDKDKFLMEFTDAFFKVNVMILNDPGTPSENHRAVIKMFKDTLSNIGDIITGSKASLIKIFDNPEILKYENGDYE